MRIEKGVSSNYSAADGATKETSPVGSNDQSGSIVDDKERMDVSRDKVINDDMLDNAVKQANKNLDQFNKVIERSVHEKTHAVIYVLKDTLTNEVIKEFPPRKIEDMIAKMWEMAGILVDERR
jgi:flagellar protein FlaG